MKYLSLRIIHKIVDVGQKKMLSRSSRRSVAATFVFFAYRYFVYPYLSRDAGTEDPGRGRTDLQDTSPPPSLRETRRTCI